MRYMLESNTGAPSHEPTVSADHFSKVPCSLMQELFISHNASESREQSLHILVSSLKTQSNNQAVTAFLEPISYQNYLTTCIKRHLVLQKKYLRKLMNSKFDQLCWVELEASQPSGSSLSDNQIHLP